MLQQMRKFAKSWVASIFLGVLALSFGVWGIADIFKGTTDTSVATVGNVKISQDEFQSQYQTALRNQSIRMGTQLSAEQAQAMGLPQNTLERIIDRTAIDHEVEALGLTATDKAVADQIRAIPAFAGPSGSFDHNTFLRAIQRSGYTEQSFIAAVRSDTARSQLLDATRNGLQAPSGFARALFDYLNEARAVHYVTVPASAAGTLTKPTDAELQAYVKSHANRFSTPEYRELTYAAITPDDLANEITVTDKQLHNEYELRKADYQVPEKRDVEQITFPDQKAAEAASAQIQAGKSFEDIAKARSLKPSDIKLGELQQADLGTERGKAAFAAGRGRRHQARQKHLRLGDPEGDQDRAGRKQDLRPGQGCAEDRGSQEAGGRQDQRDRQQVRGRDGRRRDADTGGRQGRHEVRAHQGPRQGRPDTGRHQGRRARQSPVPGPGVPGRCRHRRRSVPDPGRQRLCASRSTASRRPSSSRSTRCAPKPKANG